MMQPHGNRSLVIALYANAAFLAAILLVLLARGNGGSGLMPAAYGAQAGSPAPIAGANGIYVMPAQFLSNIWGCYVLDTDGQTLCAYAFYGNSTKPELRLIAARNIQWDRKLGNYNTALDPQAIRRMVEIQQEPIRGASTRVPQTQETVQTRP
jgi:hypothetical protein